MKKILTVSAGLIFFPVGYWVNGLILSEVLLVNGYFLMGIAALLLWFLWGILASRLVPDGKQAMLLGNAVPFTVLLLILFQELLMGFYWHNTLGTMGQMYYLPLINLSSRVCFLNGSFAWVYLTAFLLLCGAFYLGLRMGRNRK